jgi:hypothetical protein
MSKTALIDALNHTAAYLLVSGEQYPDKAAEMRRLASCLQLMAVDVEDMPEAVTAPGRAPALH